MTGALALVLGMALDALLGEPRWIWGRLPHPAVLMGRAVSALEQRLNQGRARRVRGVLALALLVAGAALLGGALAAVPGRAVDILVIGALLAQRSLVDHVRAVARGLRGSVSTGRVEVAKIVGRDCSNMDRSAVARGAIESAAENLSDGVIAPVIWYALGGLPGLLIYKITNTADSMIGYRTERYREFGWAAARFDDLLNLLPARATALLLWLPTRRGTWPELIADARLHRSPNAGWPEAAMARTLGIALSGPRSYDGTLRAFPWVHATGRKTLVPADIDAACNQLWRAWALAFFVAALGVLL